MKRAGEGADVLDPKLAEDAQSKSKSMIGVGEEYRPFLDYLLFNLNKAGYREVVIVINERDESIRGYYGNADRGNRFLALSIGYAIQQIPAGRKKPLGTADALVQALRARPEWKGKKFTVCNSDNLYSVRALRLLLESPDEGALIDYDRRALEFDPKRIEQFAVIRTGSDVFLEGIVEKPSPEEIAALKAPDGRVGVSMNIFRFSYDVILPALEATPIHPLRKEKELPVTVDRLVRERKGSIRAIPLAEHVPDLTHKADIPRVQEYLRKNYPSTLS